MYWTEVPAFAAVERKSRAGIFRVVVEVGGVDLVELFLAP
jgi:hypothetical protein